jgi:hypothetical protein
VTEAEYWGRLERRVCRELAGMEERALRFLWCDGFMPEQYLLDDSTPRITGAVWIGSAPKQERWRFTLFLRENARTRQDISWESLLPVNQATGWLGVDVEGRQIHITISSAERLNR